MSGLRIIKKNQLVRCRKLIIISKYGKYLELIGNVQYFAWSRVCSRCRWNGNLWHVICARVCSASIKRYYRQTEFMLLAMLSCCIVIIHYLNLIKIQNNSLLIKFRMTSKDMLAMCVNGTHGSNQWQNQPNERYLIQNDSKTGDITIAPVVDAHIDRYHLAGRISRRWNRCCNRYVIQFHW